MPWACVNGSTDTEAPDTVAVAKPMPLAFTPRTRPFDELSDQVRNPVKGGEKPGKGG